VLDSHVLSVKKLGNEILYMLFTNDGEFMRTEISSAARSLGIISCNDETCLEKATGSTSDAALASRSFSLMFPDNIHLKSSRLSAY